MSGIHVPLLLALRSWSDVWADVRLNWIVYLSMPFVAAFVGYVTKLMALVMLYHPIEFRGIGPFGWQGIVPGRAAKVGATTIDLLTENLLDLEELLDQVDIEAVLDGVHEPLAETTEDIARSVAGLVRPGLWEGLPTAARAKVLARISRQMPVIVDRIMDQIRSDVGRFIDLKYLTVTTLVRNKAKLNTLIQSIAGDAMGFVRRSGIYFGLSIGLLQMVAWGYLHNPWIMPGFGFAIGLVSDWLALTMLFRPAQPIRIVGLFPFQGVLHARREQITRDYAEILAADLFSPDIILSALIEGPAADRIFAFVGQEVSTAIDEQLGVARPVVQMAVGAAGYRRMKKLVVDELQARLPDTLAIVGGHTFEVLDVAGVISEKMGLLNAEEYESIMRPVFKDDEPLMIAVGALLGAAVGELQVQIVEHFARTR